MKLKAVISGGAPSEIVNAVQSTEFAVSFLEEVIGKVFGVKDPVNRPAEFYVQEPDRTINTGGGIGVELRLTGVSRNGRKIATFHQALETLHQLAKKTLQQAANSKGLNVQVQVFTVIMLDGDVETSPGSGQYSNVLESTPDWISTEGVSTFQI